MKNILFIQPTITHRAGIDIAIMPIIKFLSERDYKVYTLSIYEKYKDIESVNNGAINFTIGEDLNKINSKYKIINYCNKFYKMFNRSYFIYKVVQENNIDFVISSGDGIIISTFLAGFVMRRKLKMYAYIHENLKNINSINRFILKYILTRFHKVVSVSDGLNESMINIKYRDKFIVIENCLDYKNIKINKSLNIKKEKKIFLAIGRLEDIKGYYYLIMAFSQAVLEMDSSNLKENIELQILGEGNERNNLEQLIKELKMQDHVKLMGQKDNVFEYLENAYAFVNCSKTETFGISLLEAMYMQVPVIINNCDFGPREICGTGIQPHIFAYGILCDKENVNSLKQAILNMCRDNLYKNLNLEKEKERAEYYAIENIINKWLKILAL